MLPCVCSVIDHRWRQNVVRTKKWHIAEFVTDASYASAPIELVDRGGHVLSSSRLLNLIEMPLILIPIHTVQARKLSKLRSLWPQNTLIVTQKLPGFSLGAQRNLSCSWLAACESTASSHWNQVRSGSGTNLAHMRIGYHFIANLHIALLHKKRAWRCKWEAHLTNLVNLMYFRVKIVLVSVSY